MDAVFQIPIHVPEQQACRDQCEMPKSLEIHHHSLDAVLDACLDFSMKYMFLHHRQSMLYTNQEW